MILERTGDSRWYMKYTDLRASADEWEAALHGYLEGLDERV